MSAYYRTKNMVSHHTHKKIDLGRESFEHEYRNASRMFNQIEALYQFVNDCNDGLESEDYIIALDENFQYVCDILEEKLYTFKTPQFRHFDFPAFDLPNNDKEITICLSGGKDSTAVVKYYKDRGYKVHLYHMKGINRAYGDEYKAAERVARYFDCELYMDRVWMNGQRGFIEHPLKNYLIACGAINFIIGNNYSPNLCFGNFHDSSIDYNEFEVCGGDCIEMWDAFEQIIRKIIPNFKMHIPLKNNHQTFEIFESDLALFDNAVSCMSPYRFRETWKQRTEQKFNIRLFENRCGCCWKDCLEWIYLVDHNRLEYHEEYYLHCIGIFIKTIYKEQGIIPDCIEDAWNQYMFYPMSESKAWEILKDATIGTVRTDIAAQIKRKK